MFSPRSAIFFLTAFSAVHVVHGEDPAVVNERLNQLHPCLHRSVYLRFQKEGLASYHLCMHGGNTSWISHANDAANSWQTSSGQRVPITKYFQDASYAAVSRRFRGNIDWSQDPMGQCSWWVLDFQLSEDYLRIDNGKVDCIAIGGSPGDTPKASWPFAPNSLNYELKANTPAEEIEAWKALARATFAPTLMPTAEPTITPTSDPTVNPTTEPTLIPTAEPTLSPAVVAAFAAARDANATACLLSLQHGETAEVSLESLMEVLRIRTVGEYSATAYELTSQQILEAVDADVNGKISVEEWLEAGLERSFRSGVAQEFMMTDISPRDGVVSRAEFAAIHVLGEEVVSSRMFSEEAINFVRFAEVPRLPITLVFMVLDSNDSGRIPDTEGVVANKTLRGLNQYLESLSPEESSRWLQRGVQGMGKASAASYVPLSVALLSVVVLALLAVVLIVVVLDRRKVSFRDDNDNHSQQQTATISNFALL